MPTSKGESAVKGSKHECAEAPCWHCVPNARATNEREAGGEG